jgi:hypothetical protein
VQPVDLAGGGARERVVVGLPAHQLGPLGQALRGKHLLDVAPIPGGVEIRTHEGLAVVVQWRSDGAELAGMYWNPAGWGTERHLPPNVAYVFGKALDSVYTRDGLALVVLADGHALRFVFDGSDPALQGVSVYVMLPSPVASLSAAGGLQ